MCMMMALLIAKKAQGRYDDASAGAKFYFALYKYREYFSIFEH